MADDALFSKADAELLMRALDQSTLPDGEVVLCERCLHPILVLRDAEGKPTATRCDCGKYSRAFRGL